MPPPHMTQRGRRWYAVLEIPKPLRPSFGKRRFFQSLGTDSLAAAQRRVGPVIAAWRSEIARARLDPNDDAAFFRRSLANAEAKVKLAKTEKQRAEAEKQRQLILEEIDMAAWDIGAINANVGQQPSSDPEAQIFQMRATGQLVTFTEYLNEWLGTSRATAKTQDMQRADVKRFASEFQTVQDVTRPEVRRWVSKLTSEGELAPNTVKRTLSGLRSYWRYLQSISVAGEDNEPFSKLSMAWQSKSISPRSLRQPFEPSDIVRLLEAAIAKGDDDLADLIRLGMWTGCRIEELCALTVEKVKADYFSVVDAKTAAGWRDVPIHRELAQTMARLIGDSKDGYVLSGLTANKYGDRSNAIGKRFGRLKTSLGFGPQFVFHSIRKTVVTILENAGVAENVVADIIGHEKATMTYGLYSGGASLAVKRDALAKLTY